MKFNKSDFGNLGNKDYVSYTPTVEEKLTPEQVSAIILARGGGDLNIIEYSADRGPAVPIVTEGTLEERLQLDKMRHIRPMSQKEYDDLLFVLKTKELKDHTPVYQYELSAIAKVIKENFAKFLPKTELDAVVDDYFYEIVNLDPAFNQRFEDALIKYRDPFALFKAEDKFSLYTAEEKNFLKSQGIAFINYSPEVIQAVETVNIINKATKAISKEAYIHPMLRYGLIKGK